MKRLIFDPDYGRDVDISGRPGQWKPMSIAGRAGGAVLWDEATKKPTRRDQEFVTRVRGLLDRCGYTMQDLADEMGADLSQVSRWLSGEIHPHASSFDRLEGAVNRLRARAVASGAELDLVRGGRQRGRRRQRQTVEAVAAEAVPTLSWGDWLRTRMDVEGRTPAEIAELVRVSPRTVDGWLAGRAPSPEAKEAVEQALRKCAAKS